ncbi:hypothetical protein ACYPKM_05570 [Pseudomonas aeruginosa]
MSFDWVDMDGRKASVSVTFTNDEVRDAYLQGKDLYNQRLIFTKVTDKAKEMAQNISDSNAMIVIDADIKTEQMDIKRRYKPGFADLAKERESQVKEFTFKAYKDLEPYTYYRLDDETHHLMINYPAVVRDYRFAIERLNEQFKERDQARRPAGIVNDRLSFLQSIPYDELENEDYEFLTPIRMLHENRGDCESKQIVMAGMLKLIFPSKKVFLVTLKDQGHIVTALQADEVSDSLTTDFEGRKFLILDATGPDKIQVADSPILINRLGFYSEHKIWDEVIF